MNVLDGYQQESIARAVELLREGGVVAFPTETVYGLGADAFNPMAVARIFEVKKRPHFDPLIVHIGGKAWLDRIAERLEEPLARLIDRFWPGPLTVIVKKRPSLPDIVTAGLPTVGVRMPSHPVALHLLRDFGGPIAAPSANPFGYMSPTRAGHVSRMFSERLPLILDGGSSTFGIESTIVSVQSDGVVVHRFGAVSLEELREVVPLVTERRKGATDPSCTTPGELPYHYAPHRPLVIIDSPKEIGNPRSSYLAFREIPRETPVLHVKVLSGSGDLREAAAHFFSHLIELDTDDVDVIYAEKIPEEGLGRAMMERLRKASKKHHP